MTLFCWRARLEQDPVLLENDTVLLESNTLHSPGEQDRVFLESDTQFCWRATPSIPLESKTLFCWRMTLDSVGEQQLHSLGQQDLCTATGQLPLLSERHCLVNWGVTPSGQLERDSHLLSRRVS